MLGFAEHRLYPWITWGRSVATRGEFFVFAWTIAGWSGKEVPYPLRCTVQKRLRWETYLLPVQRLTPSMKRFSTNHGHLHDEDVFLSIEKKVNTPCVSAASAHDSPK